MLLNLYQVLKDIKQVYHDNWCALILLIEIDGRTMKGKYNDYIAERMTSRLSYNIYIQDQ